MNHNANDNDPFLIDSPLLSQSFPQSQGLMSEDHTNPQNYASFQPSSYESVSFLNDAAAFTPSLPAQQDSYMPKEWEAVYAEQDSSMIMPMNHHSHDFMSIDAPNHQDILMSDPFYVRQQQQLLMEERQRSVSGNAVAESMNKGSQVKSQPIMRSNLSAMFSNSGHSRPQAMPEVGPSQSYEPMSEPQLIPQSVPNQDYLGYPRTNPVPIARSVPLGEGDIKSGAALAHTEIDHQRRQNELQARFRVNYTKRQSVSKPMQGASSQGVTTDFAHAQNLFGTSMPNVSGGFSDFDDPLHSTSAKVEPISVGIPRSNPRMFAPTRSDTGSSNGIGGTFLSSSLPTRTVPIQIQRVHRPNTVQMYDAEQYQKKLDDQLIKVDFDDITVSELKEMLRQRGKPATGKKAVLIQRLQMERDLAQAMREGKKTPQQRHSQPPPPVVTSSIRSPELQARPKSFQGSSPMMSPVVNSPASVPSNAFIPGSPGSAYSLTRSVANMHIGSPPPTTQSHLRRYAPYATPGSPRLSSSPKPFQYSSSLPSQDHMASSLPVNPTPSLSFSSRSRAMQAPVGSNIGKRQYAPFTSSALATPDREEDQDPFDHTQSDGHQTSTEDRVSQSVPANMDGLEWMDTSIDTILQQASQSGHHLSSFNGMTQEDLMAFLDNSEHDMYSQAGQGFDRTFNTSHDGYISWPPSS